MYPAARRNLRRAQGALLKAIGGFDVGNLATYRKRKIIHDPVWGTCSYEPWEATLLDLEVFQRLRGLRQTGFAFFTYPSAEHSRFQHTLGVVEAATRLFDSIFKSGAGLSPQARRLLSSAKTFRSIHKSNSRWRMLLRLAAMVHDLGHSVFSHTSERIYSLVPPFPSLIKALTTNNAKPPGAAEVIVYLLVTSKEWQAAVRELWRRATRTPTPPTKREWERIGRWVLGQEESAQLKFIADIISGPLDADKLDYVFRDGYVAGIPVGYDLERLVSTVCVDPQRNLLTGKVWWRLTLPVRGINALEQLVMGRLVLNSYLYHHQKCRAAEASFERLLAREWLRSRSILGRRRVWDLFMLQDGHVADFARGSRTRTSRDLRDLLRRRLKVRVLEFRRRDIEERSEFAAEQFSRLQKLASPRSWEEYRRLLRFEDRLARKARLPRGSVILDFPKPPDYADLQNLLLPGRTWPEAESPEKILNYRDWIEAYKVHRAFVRIFGPRGRDPERRVWDEAKVALHERSLTVPRTARIGR